MTVRNFIQCSNGNNIKLKPAVYSKKLYKEYDLIMGTLCGRVKYGQTYKEMNTFVKKYKWD